MILGKFRHYLAARGSEMPPGVTTGALSLCSETAAPLPRGYARSAEGGQGTFSICPAFGAHASKPVIHHLNRYSSENEPTSITDALSLNSPVGRRVLSLPP